MLQRCYSKLSTNYCYFINIYERFAENILNLKLGISIFDTHAPTFPPPSRNLNGNLKIFGRIDRWTEEGKSKCHHPP